MVVGGRRSRTVKPGRPPSIRFACVKALHANDPDMLVVVQAGLPASRPPSRSSKLGACHYLAKPSSTDDIEAAVQKAAGDADIADAEGASHRLKPADAVQAASG